MDLLDNIEAGMTAQVNNLKTWAARFTDAYNQFLAIPVQFRTENWQSVKNRADAVKATISTITSGVDTAYRWLQSAFGLQGMGQLGLIVPAAPWLSIAAIGAAISAIMLSYSYIVEELNQSAYKREKWEIDKKRIEQGLEPLYADIYKPTPTVFGDAANLAKWVIIGGAALFIVPKILEKWKGK